MKKTIAAVLAAVSISLAAGCAANLPAGYDIFTAAREKYETLSSGRVTMTDLTTGDEIMRFSFYFNVNDEMVFSYWGSWQGEALTDEGRQAEPMQSQPKQFYSYLIEHNCRDFYLLVLRSAPHPTRLRRATFPQGKAFTTLKGRKLWTPILLE